MANIGGGRALRVCDLCGLVDDHPRHVIAGSPGVDIFEPPSQDVIAKVLESAPKDQQAALLQSLLDTTSSDRHMDCCREAGCPDGSCAEVTKGAEDKRGKALLTHLTKGK